MKKKHEIGQKFSNGKFWRRAADGCEAGRAPGMAREGCCEEDATREMLRERGCERDVGRMDF